MPIAKIKFVFWHEFACFLAYLNIEGDNRWAIQQ
jgi:hypothetical protein